jgi:hypothetical protein
MTPSLLYVHPLFYFAKQCCGKSKTDKHLDLYDHHLPFEVSIAFPARKRVTENY